MNPDIPPDWTDSHTGHPSKPKHSIAARRIILEDILLVLLVVGDACMFLLGQFSGFWLRFDSNWFSNAPFAYEFGPYQRPELAAYTSHFFLGTVIFLLAGAYFGIFGRESYLRPLRTLAETLRACLAWFLFYLLLSLALRISPAISRIYVAASAGFGMLFLIAWRSIFTSLIRRSGLIDTLQQRILVVGWTKEAEQLWERLQATPHGAYAIAGIIEGPSERFSLAPPKELTLGSRYKDIPEALKHGDYDVLLVAELAPTNEEAAKLVSLCHRELVHFMAIPAFFEVLISGVHLESLHGIPTLTIGRLPLDYIVNRILKRLVDILGSLVGLALSAPLLVILTYLVYREDKFPLFFSQTRIGRKGRPFRIYKIRSMKRNVDDGSILTKPGDERCSQIGAFMRRWNLDELPQFWNVLRGEMSLVGPRPERPKLIASFKESIEYYNIRHAVKPGITGWAQVNGLRGFTDRTERTRFDIDYIERWSLLFDFYIMVLTFFRYKNAY